MRVLRTSNWHRHLAWRSLRMTLRCWTCTLSCPTFLSGTSATARPNRLTTQQCQSKPKTLTLCEMLRGQRHRIPDLSPISWGVEAWCPAGSRRLFAFADVWCWLQSSCSLRLFEHLLGCFIESLGPTWNTNENYFDLNLTSKACWPDMGAYNADEETLEQQPTLKAWQAHNLLNQEEKARSLLWIMQFQPPINHQTQDGLTRRCSCVVA